MKIAFITCHNIKNYGSVLQTYATQTLLENMGHKVFVIDYRRPGTDDSEILETRMHLSGLSRIPVLSTIFRLILIPSVNLTIRVFGDFLKKYIHLTERTYRSNKELLENIPEADLYITGSDQVWNSHINKGIEYPYYLAFTPEDSRRISFASSFGLNVLPDNEKAETKRLLQRYEAISVRESNALAILEDLEIQNGKNILDPTFMLPVKQWLELAEYTAVPKERYVLVYQLRANKKFDKYVLKFSKTKKIRIVRINYCYHNAIKNKGCITCPTPNEVIGLIDRADYVLTDSFHATAFSIMLHKKFKTILPDFFTGRIHSILQKVGMQERILTSFDDFDSIDENVDYDHVDCVLERERAETRSWLINAISEF